MVQARVQFWRFSLSKSHPRHRNVTCEASTDLQGRAMHSLRPGFESRRSTEKHRAASSRTHLGLTGWWFGSASLCTALSLQCKRLLLPLLSLVALLASPALHAADPTPLPRAHAHNDYRHPRPLLDALDNGFGSVEADIFLVDGQLLVAHDRDRVQPERTLQALYLDPLRQRFKANGGQIHKGMNGFMLLIDIKAEPQAVWPVLRTTLNQYRELFTRFTDTSTITGAVTVVLSGARPIQQVQSEPERLCGIDGRLVDLDSNPSRHLYPLVSESWRPTFGGFDEEQLTAADRKKLRELVSKAHSQGRRIRFWGVPDQRYAWEELDRAGVDLLNTDKLPALAEFLRSRPDSPAKP